MNLKKILILSAFVFMLLFSKAVYSQNLDTANLDVVLQNQDPDPAEAGEYLELRFKVYKTGNNPAENINFRLETKHPFYFDKSDQADRNITRWNGQSGEDWYYTLYYKLRVDENAIEDDYELDLKYWYNNQNIKSIKEFTIRVGENKEPNLVLGNIITSPTKLVSDTDEAEIKIEIQNIGDEDAENVVSELKLPKGFSQTYAYSTRENLGTISKGSSKTTKFYVDIDEDLKSKSYLTNLMLNYKKADDKDNTYIEKTIDLNIPLKSKPRFKILDYNVVSGELAPENKVEIKFRIKNIGSKDAESVSIRMFKDTSQPVDLKEKFDFIGDIDVNKTGEGILSFEIEKQALAKEYNFDIQLRSVNDLETYLENKTISLEFNKETEKKSIIPQVILGIVILGLVILASYNFGKNKANNKNKKK